MLKLQRATPKDSLSLAEMNHRLIRDEGHSNPMNVAQLARRMRIWLKGRYRAYFLNQGGVKAGYCVFRDEKGFLYIRQFFIEREFRRKGMGRKFFETLRKNVWKKWPLLRLDVLTGNKAGIRFWRSLGFKERVWRMERKNR